VSRVRTLAALGLAAQYVPAATAVAPLRRRLLPSLAGVARHPHVALTYDDGPDESTTPAFLDLLERHGVTATFFLLGAHVERHRSVVRDLHARGHELAVHGWDHRCTAVKRPGALPDELRRTVGALTDVTGTEVRWYRPPYGVLTTEALVAAHAAGLRTVLWSAWGRDWERAATPESVAHRVASALRPGGTVLLHDTDRTSAPGSWRATLAASGLLLADWADRGYDVGPLRDHRPF
jgi:peptidoglycan/xylan/chitin deacetylase (PgdA/CDA1 family)